MDVRALGFPLSSILGDNLKATRGTLSGINAKEGHKVFQIDANINPGNSGGPLVTEPEWSSASTAPSWWGKRFPTSVSRLPSTRPNGCSRTRA